MADRVLLDVSRLISRVGQGPWTGIDRVEAQYLSMLRDGDCAVARIGSRRAVVSARRAKRILLEQQNDSRRVVELKFLLLARGLPSARTLGLWAAKQGFGRWVSVGHTNLKEKSLTPLRVAGVAPVVLVHDTIPLDHPEWNRNQEPAAGIEHQMRSVSIHAACVIYPSQASQSAAEKHFAAWGRVPPGRVVPLGSTLETVPDRRPGEDFVAIGTVEPRKGYDTLLEIWGALGPNAPRLQIFGRQGWARPELCDKLRSTQKITWHENASDTEVQQALASARALLFPSRSEGFGLPLAEALEIGVPVIASDLPVFRELFGDKPYYCPVGDVSAWIEALESTLSDPDSFKRDWDAHRSVLYGTD
jgi:glycosyltransferase involved in cell wall biosynthesis